ncbi:MAG: hypothetical protein Tsb0032_06500 [Kiloniellaceae bacterium]
MPSTTPRLPLAGSTLVAVATLAATLFLLWHTFDPIYESPIAGAGRGPVFFPRILLGLMVVFSLAVIGQSLKAPDDTGLAKGHLWPVVIAAVATGGYLYVIYLVGYLLATAAFSFVLPLVFGYRRWAVIAVFAAVYAGVTWYLFEVIFRIVLPKSPWFIHF